MKIITPGIALPRWPAGARVTCPVCQGVYELEDGDLVRVSADGLRARIACPNCGEVLVVAKGAT
jgi:uncharacterized Zn-finger protein